MALMESRRIVRNGCAINYVDASPFITDCVPWIPTGSERIAFAVLQRHIRIILIRGIDPHETIGHGAEQFEERLELVDILHDAHP